MSEEYAAKPPTWFWIVAVLFLLWNLIGCSMYVMEMTMSDAAYADAFGPELAAVRDVYPAWGLSGYALAVWGGLIAAILFVLRKSLSVPIFIFSLVMAVIGFIPTFTNPVLKDAAGAGYWVMPLVVVVLGIIEILYSRKQRVAGILR